MTRDRVACSLLVSVPADRPFGLPEPRLNTRRFPAAVTHSEKQPVSENGRKKVWLEPFTWEMVNAINRALCQPKKALHQPTSDGYEPARKLWERQRRQGPWLDEAVDVCRRCHGLGHFCNFNGYTFAAIARQLTQDLHLPADQAHVVRSWAGHIVAGTADDVEADQFHQFSRALTAQQLRK